MLVSIPFRDVRIPHGETSEGQRYCFTPPTRSTALGFNSIFKIGTLREPLAKTDSFASFLNLAEPNLYQGTILRK